MKTRLRNNLRDIVFGLEDGMVSTLGVVTGIAIGSESKWIVLLAAFVVIFVESLSMAAGSYLSAKSETEALHAEIEEEKRQIREHHAEEMEEWRDFYRERGLDEDDIAKIEDHYKHNEDLLLEDMMHKELGITTRFLRNPGENAFFMLVSYFVGGLATVASYFVLPLSWALPVSIVLTFVLVFVVGFAKGKFVNVSPWKSGLEMLLISLAAAGVGFLVGKAFGAIIPQELL